MKLYGLIGFPLGHSFSRRYFTEKFDREGIADCEYRNFPIESIEEVSRLLSRPELQGFNVTIPYKQQNHTLSERPERRGPGHRSGQLRAARP